jgi:hypothetical protein
MTNTKVLHVLQDDIECPTFWQIHLAFVDGSSVDITVAVDLHCQVHTRTAHRDLWKREDMLPRVYDGFILESYEDHAFAYAKRFYDGFASVRLDIKACTIQQVETIDCY